MQRRGFTLMELLVVISIIMVLAGMILGAVSMIRRQAREVQCRNNLQQIGIGITRYQQENGNLFPPHLTAMLAHGQALGDESAKILRCGFDTKKGTDPQMGRPGQWGDLHELYDSGSSYQFEAAQITMFAPDQGGGWTYWKVLPGSGLPPSPLWTDDGRTTWAEAKAYQLKHGNLTNPFSPSQVPIVRCFWHQTWDPLNPNSTTPKVVNLAWDVSVFLSIPFWEHQANPAIPFPN